MKNMYSIKGNKIVFDPASQFLTLEKVLLKRFGEKPLGKSLDDLYDPYLLSGMKEAIERIKMAKNNGEKIMIFGDYDVDGVTSTSLLMHFFKKIGIQASYRLPHRIHDGYGMKKYFIDEIADLGVNLIITVDCGTRDIEVIEYAKVKGVDVIITDHHAVPEIIPESAVAIINPKRKDCTYPFKHLAGAGVAFKLMSALAYEFLEEQEAKNYILESIDIAAIGTVADCMPLIDENRIIVEAGLKQIKKSRSLGMRKIIEDKIHDDLDADIFGFLIGPRLNAAGRLDTPYKAVNLILNNSEGVDLVLQDIEQINTKRKDLTKLFVEDALGKVNQNDNVLFYDSTEIEHGIIGIVAGRLTEQFYKPSIVLKNDGEKLVASCRSPDYFSIIEFLEKYKGYFLHFGGHKQAAGFSIACDQFEMFKKDFLSEVNALDFREYKKEVVVDKIVNIEEFGYQLYEKMNQYKPFGMGNPKPIFMFQNFEIEGVEFLGKTKEHITIKNKYGIKIIGFFFGEYYQEIKNRSNLNILFEISQDEWMGKRTLSCRIIDIFL